MFLTGISDEAGKPLASQIKAHQLLGWKTLEVRDVQIGDEPSANLHDISDAAFDRFVAGLEDAAMSVYCFSSRIANWGKKIDEPFESSLAEARRAIPRMKRLGTRFIRIMSFAVRDGEDQMKEERFRRLRELVKLFSDEGLVPVHENCMNYGGMGWPFTLEMLEAVPGLKLVFDTGNPVFTDDRSKDKPWPKQSAWTFFQQVKPHVAYVHIKDGIWDAEKGTTRYCFPGEGQGNVSEIIADLHASGYKGGVSIEPHMGAVYHEKDNATPAEAQFSTYVEYGKRLKKLVESITGQPASGSPA